MSDMKGPEYDDEKAVASNDPQQAVANNPDVIDFDGSNDPEHPMNWSSAKKTVQIVIVTFMTLLSPIGSTINASASLDILAHFDSSNETVGTLITTIFLLGYAFGPIVIAPLSELYGRAIPYKICILFFVAFNVACKTSNSLPSLVVYRFLAGIMGSCPVTLGTGSIADMVATEKRAGAIGAYIIGAVFSPAIGPVNGGFLAPSAGWRWTFWFVAIASGVIAVTCILFVRESYPYVLLERKARCLRCKIGNAHIRSALDAGKTPGSLFAFLITRPLKMLLSPIVFLLSLYAATVYSYLYLCFTTLEVVFYGQYGFTSSEAGLATLRIGVGSVLGCIARSAAANSVSKRLTQKYGSKLRPEY